jgi:hypothetical protein
MSVQIEFLKNEIEKLERRKDFINIFQIIRDNEPIQNYIINDDGVF